MITWCWNTQGNFNKKEKTKMKKVEKATGAPVAWHSKHNAKNKQYMQMNGQHLHATLKSITLLHTSFPFI